MGIPQRSEIVIIGGGVIGASIAYHLAERGKADVTLVERKSLTTGSTWHAAGLVGQLRSSSSLTQLMRKSVETYQALEGKTGYATGWRGVGGLRVASSPGRWEELRRVYTRGKSFGFDIHLVSPGEGRRALPAGEHRGRLRRRLDAVGRLRRPEPAHVLLHRRRPRRRGPGRPALPGHRDRAGRRRVTAVRTEQGRIECDVAVNATGMWGAETAKLAGVQLAVNAVEHQYVVTEKSDAIPRDLPTFRDPDARFYLKPERPARWSSAAGRRAPAPAGAPSRTTWGPSCSSRITSGSPASPRARRTGCRSSATWASTPGSTGRSRSHRTRSR